MQTPSKPLVCPKSMNRIYSKRVQQEDVKGCCGERMNEWMGECNPVSFYSHYIMSSLHNKSKVEIRTLSMNINIYGCD